MLSKGNKKLGPKVMTFSLPNISTCPGRSELCESLCYVDNYQRRYPSVSKAYERNYKLSLRSTFVNKMSREILSKKPETVRIHVSGDFYRNEYIEYWIQIAKRFPNVKFYAYTRSWAVTSLRSKLREFGRLNNVKLWLSWDKEMRNIPGSMAMFPIAYMAIKEEESQKKSRLSKSNLIFRVSRRTVKHKLNGTNVCPLERGKEVNLTCSKCKICF
jgi:hypothetical protein